MLLIIPHIWYIKASLLSNSREAHQFTFNSCPDHHAESPEKKSQAKHDVDDAGRKLKSTAGGELLEQSGEKWCRAVRVENICEMGGGVEHLQVKSVTKSPFPPP